MSVASGSISTFGLGVDPSTMPVAWTSCNVSKIVLLQVSQLFFFVSNGFKKATAVVISEICIFLIRGTQGRSA